MMEKLVPKEILHKSPEERNFFYENVKISHPKLELAYKKAKTLVVSDRTPLVFIIGPSGVGKTTLLTKLKVDIYESKRAEMEQNKGLIPVVLFEAKASEYVKFSWSDFYREGLRELLEPCIDNKVAPPILHGAQIIQSTSRKPTNALRSAYESAIQNRGCEAVMVDEAQHMARIPKSSDLARQMDVVKSLANITKVPHVLAGTYELLQFRNLSAQLSNRSQEVHISPYRWKDEVEKSQFKAVVTGLLARLPVVNIELGSNLEYLHVGSQGCVGVLKKWFERALKVCLKEPNNNGVTFSTQHLEETILSESTLLTMKIEISNKLKQFEITEDERQKLYEDYFNDFSASSQGKRIITKRQKSSKSKSIQRKAKRDTVMN